jgi:mRNA interferase MazF
MEKGDIILIPFPFTDLSGNKNRPALVLIEGELDITVAFISTQLNWRENTDILAKPSRENGLKKDSLIRLSKLATIDKDLAIGRLGRLEDNLLNTVNQNLKVLLKLE